MTTTNGAHVLVSTSWDAGLTVFKVTYPALPIACEDVEDFYCAVVPDGRQELCGPSRRCVGCPRTATKAG